MEQKQGEQKYGFTDEQRKAILQEEFNFGPTRNECQKTKLSAIIDWIINNVTPIYNDDFFTACMQKYWFTKQIEEWKKEHNNRKPNDDELMNIVKEDLKVRIANTMLELRKELEKQKGINKDNIWFEKGEDCLSSVTLKNDDNTILRLSEFNNYMLHQSPPYKPFFMTNQNDNGKLNGVCICKHENNEDKTKWIRACFKDKYIEPRCEITFQTNEDNKITNVEIEYTKDRNSVLTYTISLNEEGEVEKITKEGEAGFLFRLLFKEDKNYYNKEIKQLLFEDKINKHLTENIEYELNEQQKAVFEAIKEHLCVVKEKEEKKGGRKEIGSTKRK